MPKLVIDHIPMEVPAGTSVLEAAKSVGIWIPHFCYHPALGSVGACRLCAVKMLDGPVKGIQMSCMLPAQDGMVVSTTDPEALKMRSLVIEWLMTNHPHDCPVCDEGGECLLQDYTVAGGHGIRRFEGKKRTHVNQDLGPYIEHEMNRCIQCYRCVRFYQEYAGGSDFGVLGSARRVYYGRFEEGKLESPFSGTLVDICPTGVFTDRTARFRARYWDYEMAPSVCPWCSLGCNTVPAARYRELLKTIARENPAVNGPFICDRGRFTNAPVNDPARPRAPLVDGKEVTWDAALDALMVRVSELEELYGPGSLAVVGSPRLALEGNILLARLADLLGAGHLCYFADREEGERVAAAVDLLASDKASSMADVRKADCVVILEADLRDEGPMMLLAVRQAWRHGAPVFLVGKHAPLGQARTVSMEAIELSILEEVPLAIFERPVVICGTRNSTRAAIELLARADAKIACLLPGPNAFGAGLLAREHGAVTLAEAVGSGKVKGIIAVEADIPEELLAQVPLVVAADWLPTETLRRAQVVLPTAAWVEMDGTFVNNEGRAQRFRKAMVPGLPIRGLPARFHASPDKPAPFHPPRVHRSAPPGGEPRPAWRIVAELIKRCGGEAETDPFGGRWEALRGLDPEGDGVRLKE
ncbi:NADH-quinone oxidoreductase subunit NuoG [Geobacter hydrogenophilus]|uniref:NADH-quinone oxidoreductase n=1 Tax=Geobacter hydrogenophilus TaxID=40983 RepID=A0A9W6G0A3_9BACT|nr:NADH-quinone oxidoreductase subunit NuoG [Geobacter hydrogenophilus]MBT0893928.1 NADH-quinone oxidoreductase subunit NuoG [Geobacter hydrogenophilus]GLI38126.1 NADH-quinone oxidoreductase [Geobacter hydrogenophilus]